jgi:hypothetical protein
VAALLRGIHDHPIGGCGSLAGCGGGERQRPGGEPGELALKDLAEFLKNLPADGKKPPTKMKEFEPLEPMAPVASEALRKDEIVYLWGVGYDSASASVAAYEKKTPSEGGYVLLQNGSVKKMTADGFKAAKMAK